MSALLESIARRHEARMRAHSAMLRHLGLEPRSDEVVHMAKILRSTVVSCAGCPCPGACSDWTAGHTRGTPPWCAASDNFLNLKEELDTLRAEGGVLPISLRSEIFLTLM